ncbi:MAG TPA: sugar phosphate isomerase/epimerase family protein [Candidatus Limnocylindria bacterium]|nr:sugar phosphate isomerase/epimerase family protein [Candidatus Limnocylindria bacterium]
MISRRTFLQHSAFATATLGSTIGAVAAATAGPGWTVGCFNRAWTKWGMDAALDGIKSAGFDVAGLLTRTKGEALIGADATPEYLAALKKKIEMRKLTVNLGTIYPHFDLPKEQVVHDLQLQIDHGSLMGVKYLMNFGVDRKEDYEAYYRLMSMAAAYAAERGVKVVLKPHGGASGSSEEILRCLKAINHKNFSIWYDAGNIIHYTGKDPVTELEPIIEHVTGLCAKDCAEKKGEVMIQLGTGKVDFKAVFAKLKSAGFNGPIMLEGSDPGQSATEATANARANREFLAKALAAV